MAITEPVDWDEIVRLVSLSTVNPVETLPLRHAVRAMIEAAKLDARQKLARIERNDGTFLNFQEVVERLAPRLP